MMSCAGCCRSAARDSKHISHPSIRRLPAQRPREHQRRDHDRTRDALAEAVEGHAGQGAHLCSSHPHLRRGTLWVVPVLGVKRAA